MRRRMTGKRVFQLVVALVALVALAIGIAVYSGLGELLWVLGAPTIKATGPGTPVSGGTQTIMTSGGPFATPVYTAAVTFASFVPYLSDLRTVTDLGLQVEQPCATNDSVWDPMDAQTTWPEQVQGSAQLLVSSTPLAPPGWLTPLGKAAGVTQVDPNPRYSCYLPYSGTPAPGQPVWASGDQVGVTARISFSGQASYETALAEMSALGFRLGDPCYERQPQGAHVTWTPMGQESAYARTHALLVVTTTLNSDQWQRQAQASAGATKVEASPTVTCGK